MKLIRLFIYFITIYLILIYSFFNYYEKGYSFIISNENDILDRNEDYEFAFVNYNLCNISAYTPYCDGCSGITAFGYNVLDTIYYDDIDYGLINVVAGDESIPFGSVVYFLDLDMYGIVLDRGGVIGYDKNIQFDLLVNDYNNAIDFGIKDDIRYMIVRYGF